MNFRQWLNESEQMISFDFDSTLTKPYWIAEDSLWMPGTDPNEENIEKLKKYVLQGHKVIIVSSRLPQARQEIEEFVAKHKLPISGIYTTGGEKGSTLANLGVHIHHDDSDQNFEDPAKKFKGKWEKTWHPGDFKENTYPDIR